LKEVVFDSLMGVLRPIRQRRAELESSGKVEEILAEGTKKAGAIARENIARVREMVGL